MAAQGLAEPAAAAAATCIPTAWVVSALETKWGIILAVVLAGIRFLIYVRSRSRSAPDPNAALLVRNDVISIAFSANALFGALSVIAFACGWLCSQDLKERMWYLGAAAVWLLYDTILRLVEIFSPRAPTAQAEAPPAAK